MDGTVTVGTADSGGRSPGLFNQAIGKGAYCGPYSASQSDRRSGWWLFGWGYSHVGGKL
ncbi:hypothetical protein PL9631_850023 [Planktothrix paucivesiculata PCC 9631]|uniref:Uncharacterized protein n=1 Tax=Planktothrix paucivesiculata PCC 9631 TaxID=671071 RepID=A0A7Z9E5D2_9CYAN|nr:hypothetical protein PL9631_850023 [Planktothrix paucivesiculata PCC 9631]